MVVAIAEGTTLADGTEQTLLDSDLAATFQLGVMLVNMQAGDTLVVRIKSKIGSSGTLRTVYEQTFSGVQSGADVMQIGPPLPSAWQYIVTIQQTAGVNRNYSWRIDSIGGVTVANSGTLALSAVTESVAYSTAVNGIYVFVVDLGAMQASEVVTLRAYEPVQAAGTQRETYNYAAPVGVQVTPNILMASIPLSCAYGGQWSAQQNHTNARNYPYAVYKVDA